MLKRLKMLVSIGSSEGWTYACGQTVDIESGLADKWIVAGIAVDAADKIPVSECAAMSTPETTRIPAPKPKARR